MDKESAIPPGSYLWPSSPDGAPPQFTTPSTRAFKLDEGYSDEAKSPSYQEINPFANDAMPPPDWILAQSEQDRAEFAYRVLRSLRISTIAQIVDRLDPLLHIDPVVKLPPEITSEIFSYLDPQTLLIASLASRTWRSRIFDSRLWRELYINEGWRVDVDAIRDSEQEQSGLSSPRDRKSRIRYADSDVGEPKLKKRVPPSWLDSRAESSTIVEADNDGDHLMSDDASLVQNDERITIPRPLTPYSPFKSSIWVQLPNGTVKINWPHLYKQRRRLEENWNMARYKNFQLPHPSHPEESHLECVYAIQFVGKWLVSGSRDRTIRVWDLESKRLRYPPLVGHEKSVLCLQFDPSPSEDVIISGSSDMHIFIWRFSTGEMINQIPAAHFDSVLNLRFDERYLVTCSKDKLIKIWNRRELTAADKNYPRFHKGPGVTYPEYIVDTSEYTPETLETDIANGRIQTLPPYSLLMTLDGHQAAVNAIQMHGDEIVSASGDRLIKIWDLKSGACKKTLLGHEKGIACVQIDSRRIISGSNDDTVRIYDHVSGAEVACLHGHHNLVRTVQAGFGDPPGADETLRLEALAVDNEFRDAQRSGAAVDLGPRAFRRAGYHQNVAGSRRPQDIKAIGAKIPPGGGGSKWGRIVSGSYDETVIIWKKNREGNWVVSQRLRQADAAARASQTHQSYGARSVVSRPAIHHQPTQVVQVPRPQPLVAHFNGQQAPRMPQNQVNSQPQDNQPANDQPGTPGNQTPPQPGPATVVVNGHQSAAHRVNAIPPAAHQAHQVRLTRPVNMQPTSRVFKLQFDSRKIICASQDPRIVGWDFACDDEELNEASQFFTSL
ncbi:F-box and WD domain protein [Aspergillus ruber CBS 135680]|uniref:Probable E3 ubiquitin ligase complex SCF subunit sconB n=1 Tax=Aspergillus ruber (strain CBS 135680) TaxID=1388766 RepID=A0A017S583_ASPRC|nr:WD40 repeat-like protein [Aspergillus ruber CBS 135680]EYE92188.1 WD40 repeat-like protein [Aspergillus ruber CBS 135680]